MEHAQGKLLRGDVVPQDQIQLQKLPPFAGNGGDGVVGLSVRFGKEEGLLVGIASPSGENPVGQCNERFRLGALQAQDGHGPFDNASCHLGEVREGQAPLHGGLGHSKFVPATLEMLVAEDRAAYNGQVCVAAQEVMGELLHEFQELGKGGAVNHHGGVPGVEDDAVLVIIHIGGILEKPILALEPKGNGAVILPGRVIHPAGIACIFRAQGAFGVTALRGQFGGGNGSGVFFGF